MSKTARTLAAAGFIVVSALPAFAQKPQEPSSEHVKALIAQAMQQTPQQPATVPVGQCPLTGVTGKRGENVAVAGKGRRAWGLRTAAQRNAKGQHKQCPVERNWESGAVHEASDEARSVSADHPAMRKSRTK